MPVGLAQAGALRREEVGKVFGHEHSAVLAISIAISGDHLILDGLVCSLHRLKQAEPAYQLARGNMPPADVKRRRDLLREEDLVHEFVRMDCPLVAFVSISFDQLKLVLTVIELDQLENLSKISERYEAALLTEDVEDPHEIETLLLDVAVDPAQQILVVLDVVKGLACEPDLLSRGGLGCVFQEDLRELFKVYRAVS